MPPGWCGRRNGQASRASDEESELERDSTNQKFRIVRWTEPYDKSNVQNLHVAGSDKTVKFCNLKAVISVAYRISLGFRMIVGMLVCPAGPYDDGEGI